MKKRSKKGFTLIELIVVIAIIGILAAILIPQFTGFQEKARSTQAIVEAKQFATAADGYLIENYDLTTATYADTDTAAIKEIAGIDVDGTVSAVTIVNGHVYFTYATVGTTPVYTVVRNAADGSFTVTWP